MEKVEKQEILRIKKTIRKNQKYSYFKGGQRKIQIDDTTIHKSLRKYAIKVFAVS